MSPKTLIPNHTMYSQPLGNLWMHPRATTVVRSTEEWKACQHNIGSYCWLKLWNIRILSAAFGNCGNILDMNWKIIPKDLQIICFLFLKKKNLCWCESLSVCPGCFFFHSELCHFVCFPFCTKLFLNTCMLVGLFSLTFHLSIGNL